jgi:hypothetical protein
VKFTTVRDGWFGLTQLRHGQHIRGKFPTDEIAPQMQVLQKCHSPKGSCFDGERKVIFHQNHRIWKSETGRVGVEVEVG